MRNNARDRRALIMEQHMLMDGYQFHHTWRLRQPERGSKEEWVVVVVVGGWVQGGKEGT